ncbi:CoA pyrophosphatase [Vibrio sp. JC009]|uniref:CoA pyrophosphatase n=1 Tax=Vibrio sp. JC009 TaxID=2912314 RepID=UPI0023AE6E5B|nr:CoA pyrophosphatase [Vibrio sp. JC009]WED20563.1 CoA pyrophosphatase [Vibrio sp. JC009]
MNSDEFIRNFSLNLPVEYHSESLERLSGQSTAHFRKAAVLIGCVERNSGLNIILTRRARHLRHHPGQIAFPGGKYEESDHSLEQTAIREAWEETGIPAHQVEVLGKLPELVTISRFSVTPVIARVSADYQPVIDKNEVDDLFEVPASHLLNIEQLYSQRFNIQGINHRVFAIPYKHHFIWGVTAQIIQALQQQIK